MFKKILALLLALILMIPSGIVTLASDGREYGAEKISGEPLDLKEIPEAFLSDEKAEESSEELLPEETDADTSIPREPSDALSESEGEISYIAEDDDPEKERAELFESYIYQLAGLDPDAEKNTVARKNSALSAGDYLDPTEKKAYDELKTAIKKIAGGEVRSTEITINTILSDKNQRRKVVMALLADCPYDLYWFDKTLGWSCTNAKIYKFRVAKEFSAIDNEVSYTTNIVGVSDAVETAQGIVEANKAQNKFQKLKAYAIYIMENVSYNHEAADDPGYPYGNPWQLIWAFDGNPKTNIVCEGYSKAFKFLCDITTENRYWNGVECNLVTGDLFWYSRGKWDNLGGHMWNTVRIDGTNYLVDVTNCDNTNSYDFKLFLCGAKNDQTNSERLVPVTKSTAGYIYDTNTKNSFPTSALTLSQNNYEYVPILGGTGTESDPYWITDEDELRLVSKNLSAYYKLRNDILLTSYWTPIGTSSEPFTGTFDGAGHSIKNLHIDSSASYVGLFGYNKGTIQNLSVVDGNVRATNGDTGSIAGYNGGIIENCCSTGSVNASSQYGTNVGGIAGSNQGTIENCYNTGNIHTSSSDSFAGGITGYNYYSGAIRNCYNTGAIKAPKNAGGIVGGNNSSSLARTFAKNIGPEEEAASDSSVDAKAAKINNAAIADCYNIGTVSAKFAGGIAGCNLYLESIANCYYLDNISNGIGEGEGKATAFSMEQMKDPFSFSGFDFTGKWQINDSVVYPFPTLKTVNHMEQADNKTDFEGGNGKIYNPYVIDDETQLNKVRNYLDGCFILDNDITLAFDWTPIGTASEPFTGTFDGAGHSIKNLHIDSTASYVGFFGYNEGTIQNLGVVGGDIEATSASDTYAGGIAGFNCGAIENCYNTGSVSASSPTYAYTGGISGCNSGTIEKCYNTGSVSASSSGSSYIGGISGYNSSGTIEKCYNTGKVEANGSFQYYVYAGGLVGRNNSGTLKNSYNTGTVYAIVPSADSAYAGGVTGYHNSSEAIQNCYSIGTASASAKRGSRSGGIAGYSTGTFANCYYLNNMKNGIDSGSGSVTALSVTQMKKPSSFSGFDFTDTWNITSSGYPYPQLTQPEMTLNIENVNYKVEKSDFVVGWDLVLVYTDDIVPGFTYDGKLMYDLSDLGYKFGTVWNQNGTAIVTEGTAFTYVYALVINGDAVESKVSPSDNKAKTIDQDNALNRFDTNNSNTVDINDLVAVAAVYNVNGEYLNEERMSIVLLADVSGNKMVDTYDCSLIKSNSNI